MLLEVKIFRLDDELNLSLQHFGGGPKIQLRCPLHGPRVPSRREADLRAGIYLIVKYFPATALRERAGGAAQAVYERIRSITSMSHRLATAACWQRLLVF
jgi:hypothetical protein